MVSTGATREHLRRSADGEPDRWRAGAAPGASHSDSLRLAGLLLCLRSDRGVVGPRLVCVVSRLSIGKVGCEPVRTCGTVWCIGDSRTWIPLACGAALGDRNGHSWYGVLLRVRLHVLPDVVPYVSREGARV